MRKCISASITALLGTALFLLMPVNSYAQQPKFPNPWQFGNKEWPKMDWLDATTKRLEKSKSITQSGTEFETLYARAAELLDQAKKAKDNQFRFDRLIGAVNSLLDAGDKILWARKIERLTQEKDFWGAGFVLQGAYFRTRQADYFAEVSGETNSEQYVTLSRSLYQQARSAYDANEFQRARLLAEASSFIVFSLECIAQSTIPDPHIIK
jgi:hypothetical protein